MKSKVEFYKAFFEELEKKGFGVDKPSSPDYVVDILFKGKTVAFYTKNDMIEKNPFEDIPNVYGVLQRLRSAYAVSVMTSLMMIKRQKN